jgi:hypothetical protein
MPLKTDLQYLDLLLQFNSRFTGVALSNPFHHPRVPGQQSFE